MELLQLARRGRIAYVLYPVRDVSVMEHKFLTLPLIFGLLSFGSAARADPTFFECTHATVRAFAQNACDEGEQEACQKLAELKQKCPKITKERENYK